jgi:mannosyl-oligosaccharide alpha-1,2-mannosidase
MFHLRRLTVSAIVAALFLIYLVTNKHILWPRFSLAPSRPSKIAHISWSSCPRTPPEAPLSATGNEDFSWHDINVKNPIQSLQRLPRSKAVTIPQIQHQFEPLSEQRRFILEGRQDTIKQTFLRSWNTYRAKAWLHDELRPVSGTFKNPFSGWGATMVDSLDTLWIMDLRAEFEEAAAAAQDINFDPHYASQATVNMFETTIRYLGGFLAAYDLTDCQDHRLLEKAMEIGDMIISSYDTPNHMPVTRWDIHKFDQEQLAAEHGIIAELASATLEFTRLSQLTGDMRYYDIVARITSLLDSQQNRTKLPGMFPVAVNTRAEDLTQGSTFSFGAMADSAYEYFGKTFQLLGGRELQYRKLYEGAYPIEIVLMGGMKAAPPSLL